MSYFKSDKKEYDLDNSSENKHKFILHILVGIYIFTYLVH